MIVACGFDHAGYVLRDRLLGIIRDAGHEVLDFGTDRPDPIDYPDKALEVGLQRLVGVIDRVGPRRAGHHHLRIGCGGVGRRLQDPRRARRDDP
jgi:hypothetical protein